MEEMNANEAKVALSRLDAERIRPLAEAVLAIIAGDIVPLYAKAKLADIELRAIALREKVIQ